MSILRMWVDTLFYSILLLITNILFEKLSNKYVEAPFI